MKDLNNIPELLKYFRIIKPSEIDIDKGDIFYRDKYNDIMNFLKVMLTNHDDKTLNGYIKPKGAILINLNPGTDIIDYIKLITKNYYLDLIEFNEVEIFNNPDKFLKNLISVIEFLIKDQRDQGKTENENLELDKVEEKKIFLIEQKPIIKQKFAEINLLEVFLNTWQNKSFQHTFIDSNIILIWINYEIQDITTVSSKIYSFFDIFIKIPLLNRIERETFLKDFLEKNPRIVFNINDIVNYTENWEVKDILGLLKVGIFRHFMNSELNEMSNEITDILIDMIISGEYIPYSNAQISEKNLNNSLEADHSQNNEKIPIDIMKEDEDAKQIKDIINGIQESRTSDFMLNQLYENAASKNYTELTIIIDKLNKKEPLEDNDLKLLAKFPFVLNESPNRAQINLEKAKKRVDLIKQALGK
ncbi:MAG: hypothetical protein ACFFDY_08545 [Candidatus Thorarchaeota archaeon]